MSGICLSVCVYVWLPIATLRKHYWTDLRENFTTDVSIAFQSFLLLFERFYIHVKNENAHRSRHCQSVPHSVPALVTFQFPGVQIHRVRSICRIYGRITAPSAVATNRIVWQLPSPQYNACVKRCPPARDAYYTDALQPRQIHTKGWLRMTCLACCQSPF